jgi:hypothetical protein
MFRLVKSYFRSVNNFFFSVLISSQFIILFQILFSSQFIILFKIFLSGWSSGQIRRQRCPVCRCAECDGDRPLVTCPRRGRKLSQRIAVLPGEQRVLSFNLINTVTNYFYSKLP